MTPRWTSVGPVPRRLFHRMLVLLRLGSSTASRRGSHCPCLLQECHYEPTICAWVAKAVRPQCSSLCSSVSSSVALEQMSSPPWTLFSAEARVRSALAAGRRPSPPSRPSLRPVPLTPRHREGPATRLQRSVCANRLPSTPSPGGQGVSKEVERSFRI